MTVANISSANVGLLYKPYASAGSDANQERQQAGTAGATSEDVSDSVRLSPLARVAADVLAVRFSRDIEPQVFQAKSAAFHSRLDSHFRANGIDRTHAIELTIDFAGQVRMPHDHPDKHKIEAIFANDADLSNEFRRLSAAASLKQAVEDHIEFAQAYSKNPAAAMSQFGSLFSDEKSNLHFQFAENEWDRRSR